MLKGCKRFLVEGNPPQRWPWKQNVITVVAAVMIIKVVNNWRSTIQVNRLNSNYLLLQGKYVTITTVEWLMSTWHICLTEILEKKHLKLSDCLNKFKVLWLLSVLYSPLISLGPQLQRQLAAWVLQAEIVNPCPKYGICKKWKLHSNPRS